MKDRTNPCIYYVCAESDCQKGFHNVRHDSNCQHCSKYRPRKSSVKQSDKQHKKMKSINKDFKKQLKEY